MELSAMPITLENTVREIAVESPASPGKQHPVPTGFADGRTIQGQGVIIMAAGLVSLFAINLMLTFMRSTKSENLAAGIKAQVS
jgi:hypothetical protein